MRNDGGIDVIKKAIEKLGLRHKEHIAAYGEGNERRLTGRHETADINSFSWVRFSIFSYSSLLYFCLISYLLRSAYLKGVGFKNMSISYFNYHCHHQRYLHIYFACQNIFSHFFFFFQEKILSNSAHPIFLA